MRSDKLVCIQTSSVFRGAPSLLDKDPDVELSGVSLFKRAGYDAVPALFQDETLAHLPQVDEGIRPVKLRKIATFNVTTKVSK